MNSFVENMSRIQHELQIWWEIKYACTLTVCNMQVKFMMFWGFKHILHYTLHIYKQLKKIQLCIFFSWQHLLLTYCSYVLLNISSVFDKFSMLLQTIWLWNHTSHTKVNFVANTLCDNIGIVNFDLWGYGGC